MTIIALALVVVVSATGAALLVAGLVWWSLFDLDDDDKWPHMEPNLAIGLDKPDADQQCAPRESPTEAHLQPPV